MSPGLTVNGFADGFGINVVIEAQFEATFALMVPFADFNDFVLVEFAAEMRRAVATITDVNDLMIKADALSAAVVAAVVAAFAFWGACLRDDLAGLAAFRAIHALVLLMVFSSVPSASDLRTIWLIWELMTSLP